MRYSTIRVAVISLLVVVSFVSGFSQSAPAVPRPKVGLVLEGGGRSGWRISASYSGWKNIGSR